MTEPTRLAVQAAIGPKSNRIGPRRPPTLKSLEAGNALKVPAHVLFRKGQSLILWKPRGILDEATVNEIVEFIDAVEKKNKEPINRFVDLSALDAVDLNFGFVFYVALGRRLSVKNKPAVKSAFYVTSPATAHYARLHAMLTNYSPLEVSLFADPAVAAKWLCVPDHALRRH